MMMMKMETMITTTTTTMIMLLASRTRSVDFQVMDIVMIMISSSQQSSWQWTIVNDLIIIKTMIQWIWRVTRSLGNSSSPNLTSGFKTQWVVSSRDIFLDSSWYVQLAISISYDMICTTAHSTTTWVWHSCAAVSIKLPSVQQREIQKSSKEKSDWRSTDKYEISK